jgi:hypothetical protein
MFHAGVLLHDFGVSDKDIEFFMERMPDHSHAGTLGFKAPPGATFNQIPSEKNIGDMVVDGNSRPRSITSKAKPGEIEGRPVGQDAGEALAARSCATASRPIARPWKWPRKCRMNKDLRRAA